MELTEKQVGRIETAIYALTKHVEHNSVCTILVQTIREQLDDAAAADRLYDQEALRLPDIPDWRDDEPAPAPAAAPAPASNPSKQSKQSNPSNTSDKSVAAIAAWLADRLPMTLSETIDAVCAAFKMTHSDLAKLMHLRNQDLSDARDGRPCKRFLARFAELFGEGRD